VGAIHLRRDGDDLHIDELCISCRALGRNLEDIMVAAAVTLAAGRFGLTPHRVWLRALGGPRNQPALEWLGRLTGKPGPAPDELTSFAVDYEAVARLGRTELAEAVSIVVGAG
jgi:predicted enzyme involved in methoxymalonyl-ACP biosynthesis